MQSSTGIIGGDVLRQGAVLVLAGFMIGGCASWEAVRQRNIETMFAATCGPHRETPGYQSCVDEQLEAFAPE